jgi:hypothetical protein
MKTWSAGLVVAVMVGVVGFGCGGVELEEDPSSGLVEQYLEEASVDAAGGGNLCAKPTCVDLGRDKNITHVFLDFGECNVGDFRVFLTTASRGTEEVTDRLKKKGGPCKELDADYRFEVQGPDRKARVCVLFQGKFTDVRIGAKAANECRYETGAHSGKKCEPCKKRC